MNELIPVTALVVDDDPWICHFLGQFLERKGYQVRTTLSGREALEISLQFHPKLILIDMSMPVMDGFETLKRLRQQGERGAAIFITGHDPSFVPSRVKALGALGILTKPFSLHDLKCAIQDALEVCSRANPMPAPAL